jgi:hypothetical protein
MEVKNWYQYFCIVYVHLFALVTWLSGIALKQKNTRKPAAYELRFDKQSNSNLAKEATY